MAFPIALAEGAGGFNDRGIKLKMLTETGVLEYETASKVKVDGKACARADEIIEGLCIGGQLKRQLIACRVNKEGALTVINTPGGGAGIRLEKARETALYKNNSATLGTMIAVDAGTKIFCVPRESEIQTAVSYTHLTLPTNSLV